MLHTGFVQIETFLKASFVSSKTYGASTVLNPSLETCLKQVLFN
jgi:hypothetical protein